MPASTTEYAPHFTLPELLEQRRDNTVRCPVYRDGALVGPTQVGSSVTVYNAVDAKVVDAAAVSVSGDVAEYTIPAATLGAQQRGEGWRVEWSLVMPDGHVHIFRNEAALVKRLLYPVVSDIDLFRRVSALDPNGSDPLSTVDDYQDYLDEAWTEIQLQLISEGNRPNLVMSPSALREVHLTLTLALIFDDFATRLNPAWAERAADFREQHRAAWKRLRFEYDADDDGVADSRRRRSGSATTWLM